MPLAMWGIVAPSNMAEDPVGAGDVEGEAQDAVFTGADAGAQGDQAGRRALGVGGAGVLEGKVQFSCCRWPVEPLSTAASNGASVASCGSRW